MTQAAAPQQSEMAMPTFEFPAVRGIQGARAFYSTCIPFGALARMLSIDTGNTLDRSQRDVDEKRARDLSSYIQNNPSTFVIPALTGVINASSLDFVEHKSGSFVGSLLVPMDSEIKLFDGQHRAVGIIHAIKDNPNLRSNMVPVQLFTDMVLADRQQAFSDINGNAKPVSISLNHAYNRRDASNQKLMEVIDLVSSWHNKIEFERNSITGKSANLFALKTILDANRILLGIGKKDSVTDDQVQFAASYWNAIATAVHWRDWLKDFSYSPERGRADYITYHASGLMSLARLGRIAIDAAVDFETVADKLFSVNFHRDTGGWDDKCVNHKGAIISNSAAQIATAHELAKRCSISLNLFDEATYRASKPSVSGVTLPEILSIPQNSTHLEVAACLAVLYGELPEYSEQQIAHALAVTLADDDEEFAELEISDKTRVSLSAITNTLRDAVIDLKPDQLLSVLRMLLEPYVNSGSVSFLQCKSLLRSFINTPVVDADAAFRVRFERGAA
jgi:DNA sulfur modification protein DndB